MRFGPIRLTRHRAARALAGLVAAFLLSGNVLAAAGVCAIKPPATTHAAAATSAPGATIDAGDCSMHHADHTAPAATTHHCPTDDPSAQTRTVDVPAAQVMLAMAAAVVNWHDATLGRAPLVFIDHPTGPRPLYARLQRLRL